MNIRRRVQIGSNKKTSSGGSYNVNLNSQWEATTDVTNPDSTLYDGVYRSVSNYNVSNGVATMYITIKDCSSFKMYIRSYAESNYDYVMVSQLDTIINGSTAYNSTTLVKAHTRGNQQSGTALSNYTIVEFTGITSGEHTITVVYRKDSSVNSGDDRGYVLIRKSQDVDEDAEGSIEEQIDINNYLTIEALENGLNASLTLNTCEYCVDGDGRWKTISANVTTESVNAGQTLSFRANNLVPSSSQDYGSGGIGAFKVNKKFNLIGNCMSMLFGDNGNTKFTLSGKNYAFRGLFENCSNLYEVSKTFLPATTLSEYCYISMFKGCSSLKVAPDLPAKKAPNSCYRNMFMSCKNLSEAPELPASSIEYACYDNMFYGCSSLTVAPVLPASFIAQNAYCMMFKKCTNLTTVPLINATSYSSSFSGYGQCGEMFLDCKNLKYVKTTLKKFPEYCTRNWLSNVSTSGTFIVPSDADTDSLIATGLPSGWVIEFF